MKILWISHVLPYPPIGGVNQRSYNLISEIANKHEIYLFALNQRAWLPTIEKEKEAKKQFEKICKEVHIYNIPSDESRYKWFNVLFKSLISNYPFSINWLYSKDLLNGIGNFIENRNIDIIHIDTIGLANYIWKYKKLFRFSIILNHHNIESHLMLRRAKQEKNFFKKMYFYNEGRKLYLFEKILCPYFNSNIVVSELDKVRLLENASNAKIEVVPNGVDIFYFRSTKINPQKCSIIFSGSLNWYPNENGILWFIEKVWAIIKKEIPNASLTIAGKNPTLKIKEKANKDPSIKVTGFVDDIRPFLDQAEVYICPILDGGGTKIKLLDAMAMGKAIVSTSIGAEGLLIKDGKNILIADNPMEFARQVIKIIKNQKLRRILGLNARKLVEKNYSWGTIANKLNQVYINLRGKN